VLKTHSAAHFLDAVRSTLEQYRMFRKADKILVGVSGGPDSLALLTALVAFREGVRLVLRAAYVDHGLRPGAARRESDLVRRLGRRLGVPVTVLRRRVRRGRGESLEAAARRVRYHALAEMARRQGCSVLALGHTRDDQAETVLMWLLRGTGTTGLAGIPPVRQEGHVRIIRPLLNSSREQVETFLQAHGIRPLHDRTNDSIRFLRNRIRHELIPLLERRYSPQLRRHLGTLATIVREDLDWMEGQVVKTVRQTARVEGRMIRLNRHRLKKVPPALRRGVLRWAVERLQGDRQGFSAWHWLALDHLLVHGTSKAMDLPHGFRGEALHERWFLLHGCKGASNSFHRCVVPPHPTLSRLPVASATQTGEGRGKAELGGAGF
jgi:tRNA(Ile)-lysidine synthase